MGDIILIYKRAIAPRIRRKTNGLRKQSLYLLLGKPMHFVKDFSRQHRSLLPVHLSRFSPKNFRTGQAGIAEKAQLGKIKNLRPLNHERTEPIHTDRMNWFFSKPPSAPQVICSESGAVICASVSLLSRTWSVSLFSRTSLPLVGNVASEAPPGLPPLGGPARLRAPARQASRRWKPSSLPLPLRRYIQ